MNTPQGRAVRLGLFTLLGIGVLVALLVAVFGAKVFTRTDRAVLRFTNTVQGLQVGGPVVMRGVRVGSVRSIDIETNAASGRFEVPVVIEVERGQLRDLHPEGGNAEAGNLERLVQYGLHGQLQLQSVLTGQLYVDLDMRTTPVSAPPRPLAAVRIVDGLIEIPARPSKLQSLQQQLENVDFGKMAGDLTSLVQSTRELVTNPALKRALDDIAIASGSIRRVADTVDRRLPPMADAMTGTLGEARVMARRVTETTDKVKAASDRVGQAAQRADALLRPDSPTLASLQRTADELARTAQALQRSTAEDSATLQSLEGALRDVGRASRSVRELADLLEAHPTVLLRGRGGEGLLRDDPPRAASR